MRYRSDDRTLEEWIWNSRDGVTPFVVQMQDGQLGSHVQWDMDKRLPGHKPKVGDRIFVDLTEERAIELGEEVARDRWDRPYWKANRRPGETLEGFIADYTAGLLEEVPLHAPDLVVVTEEMARERGWLPEPEPAWSELSARREPPGEVTRQLVEQALEGQE